MIGPNVALSDSSIPNKSLKNGFSLPSIGFGTWKIGGRREPDPSIRTEDEVAVLRHAIHSGFRLIDTAEGYAGGRAERIIGQAIQPYAREALFLTSKVRVENMGPDRLRQACEGSLERLGTDYLDLYLLHKACETVPLRVIVREMNRLVDEGLVHAIGVSNFSTARLKQAMGYTHHPIVCNQVHYNLEVRAAERTDLLAYCQESDIILQSFGSVDTRKRALEQVGILHDVAEAHQKTLNQTALNWLLVQPNVTALVMTRNPQHLEENLGSLGWQMNEHEADRLRREFPQQVDESSYQPLR